MLDGRLNKKGMVIVATTLFALIFAILLMVYIYLMQKSWVVSRTAAYLYKDPLLSAHKMALYDINTGRYKNPGAAHSVTFYDTYWRASGTGYVAVYKVPTKATFNNVNCHAINLSGNNCATIGAVREFKRVRAMYEPHNGHWRLTLREVK